MTRLLRIHRAPVPHIARVAPVAWMRCLVLALLCAFTGVAAGQTATSPAEPPMRIGRLAVVHGEVEALLDGAPLPARVNLPVVSGLSLRAEAQARAELRIGSLVLALGPLAQLRVQALQDDRTELQLMRGALALHPRVVAAGQPLRVQAGSVTVQVLAPGSYRVVHLPAPARVEVEVFDGSLGLGGGTPALTLAAGQRVVVDTRSGTAVERGAAARNRFDEWAVQRAQRAERGTDPRVLSAELTGGEVLDEVGRWRTDPRVGPVWIPPAVDADWAPYRDGRWVWIAPWGWHWVDDAPWGFATSHYGRWAFAAGRWAWVPGASAATPVYAPALVGFFSSGPQTLGWYPLGPGEAYRPAYAVSPRVRAALDGGPAPRSADQRHRYAQTSFAATAVRRERFGAAQPQPDDRVAVTPSTLTGATSVDPAALPAPSASADEPVTARPASAPHDDRRRLRQERRAPGA